MKNKYKPFFVWNFDDKTFNCVSSIKGGKIHIENIWSQNTMLRNLAKGNYYQNKYLKRRKKRRRKQGRRGGKRLRQIKKKKINT